MRNLKSVLFAGLVAGLLGAAGCHGNAGPKRPEPGSLTAAEAPPAPQDVYYEDEPGQVWVHGRWAWMKDQWVWQPGYHQPNQPGLVWSNGRWERRGGGFSWVEGSWEQPRAGFTHVPGHWDFRGSAYVWILERWEPDQEGGVEWQPGRWVSKDEWVDGHWAARTAVR